MNSLKKILKVLLVILLSLFQISFIRNLPFPYRSLDIVLAALIFIALIDYNSGLYFMMIASVILEFYSADPFGILFLAYFFTFLAITWLFSNILTNKSFYSFAVIGMAGILIFNIIFYGVSSFLYFINFNSIKVSLGNNLPLSFFSKIAATLIFMLLLFLLQKAVSRRMQSMFIVK
ncbi:hypothetical protein A2Y83_04840 [Candidatus Falkowbacteria bacterium RBG_13_39_14]|uniref:Rod shape-determining protein MreD n=1 Tax=Candidatus Falkowbacteria bacterium RBG_13_39_14 TaxID=1797985 RepID=A0A1F5S187_9BACT|nr:MAG: hypothetical protein A2Y83_04840 [Candidatus Falkowbacteria bacterium RBG_13_39_14]